MFEQPALFYKRSFGTPVEIEIIDKDYRMRIRHGHTKYIPLPAAYLDFDAEAIYNAAPNADFAATKRWRIQMRFDCRRPGRGLYNIDIIASPARKDSEIFVPRSEMRFHEKGYPAQAIAAEFGLGTIGVEHTHKSRAGIQFFDHNQTVGTYAPPPIRHGARQRGKAQTFTGKIHAIDIEIVVAKTFDLYKWYRHCKVSLISFLDYFCQTPDSLCDVVLGGVAEVEPESRIIGPLAEEIFTGHIRESGL